MKRLGQLLIALLGCLHLCGGHWGVLQCVAWSKMLVDYSAQDGFFEGARKTFDGAHPCAMCQSIAKGRQSEQGTELPSSAKRDLALKEVTLPQRILLHRPMVRTPETREFTVPSLAGDLWSASPPSPPPRLLGWS
ncbi:hypothetical protein HNR46_002053 [Haloferula luteola]|uniref:Uncharacterized protein n=1 Tax=Haloferula luteola TaxID=595692 RepID=A0A840V899_9BACT|nr:hypothetical protein [Haloferula luteola]MBB5351814.1 hypothetical protein [Haloferula luteola]